MQAVCFSTPAAIVRSSVRGRASSKSVVAPRRGAVPSVRAAAEAPAPSAVFYHGKIVTVDADFAVREAMAVRDGRIVAVGTTREITALARDGVTQRVDLGGRMVLPGLFDSHVHATSAAMSEFDHEVPNMESIRDVLDYIAARATVVPAGGWISLSQIFITRLKEMRFPTQRI